jgi:hypothetical protein
MPSGSNIDPYDQIWAWHDIGTLLALLGMLASIFGFGSLLLNRTKYFGALKQEAKRSAGVKGISWIVGVIALAAVIPLTLQQFFRWFGETFYDGLTEGTFVENKPTLFAKIWPEQYTTATIGWALGFAVIMVVIV